MIAATNKGSIWSVTKANVCFTKTICFWCGELGLQDYYTSEDLGYIDACESCMVSSRELIASTMQGVHNRATGVLLSMVAHGLLIVDTAGIIAIFHRALLNPAWETARRMTLQNCNM